MILAIKIRLKPTTEQERLFWKSAGTARWAFNYFLAENEQVYQQYLDNGKQGKKTVSNGVVRKKINNELKPTTHQWLKEVGSNVMKQAVIDASIAFDRWLNGISGKPKFKSRHRSKPSFYVNYESLKRVQGGFQGEKLGIVKTATPLPKIKQGAHYVNPRITFDGKYWYLSVGYAVEKEAETLTENPLGIDVGVKELAVCSNGKVYKNINKTAEVQRLEKKLKRAQRQLSRKLEQNIAGYTSKRKPIWKKPLRQCQNIQKQIQVIQLLYRQLKNMRINYLHQTSSEIVKTKPSRVVMETLHVRNMMKNKHLAKAIQNQNLYEFQRQVKYKCTLHGIPFIKADRWFASSKICSCCGHKKVELKLSDRVYTCNHCGYTADRDVNAALNLANYNI